MRVKSCIRTGMESASSITRTRSTAIRMRHGLRRIPCNRVLLDLAETPLIVRNRRIIGRDEITHLIYGTLFRCQCPLRCVQRKFGLDNGRHKGRRRSASVFSPCLQESGFLCSHLIIDGPSGLFRSLPNGPHTFFRGGDSRL